MWKLSPTAVTCVEIVGKLKRARNTGDTEGDIILDYSYAYQMHARIGRSDNDADEALKFAT